MLISYGEFGNAKHAIKYDISTISFGTKRIQVSWSLQNSTVARFFVDGTQYIAFDNDEFAHKGPAIDHATTL